MADVEVIVQPTVITVQPVDPLKIGPAGLDGNDGWTPTPAIISDGERRVIQVIDWVGGEGTKPATGKYIGATGLVPLIADGIDIRGATGAAASGASSIFVDLFPATATWTKRPFAKYISGTLFAGGAGGGSGRMSATNQTASGGGGGSGGSITVFEAPASFFGSTETVTIGAGGTGGAPQGSSGMNGSVGVAGGTTQFGDHYRAFGGIGGTGGTTGTAGGGGSVNGFPNTTSGLASWWLNSGGGTTGNTSTPVTTTFTNFSPMGGGGGGGVNAGVPSSGGASSARTSSNSGIVSSFPAVAGGVAPNGDGNPGNSPLSGEGGQGGSGGAGGLTFAEYAGDGGAGAVPGGGGGGGGGAVAPASGSGRGGRGGDGYAIIITYCEGA